MTNLDCGYSVGRTESQRGPGFIMWDRIPTYSGVNFMRTRRLAAASELREPQTVTMSLLGRFLAAAEVCAKLKDSTRVCAPGISGRSIDAAP